MLKNLIIERGEEIDNYTLESVDVRNISFYLLYIMFTWFFLFKLINYYIIFFILSQFILFKLLIYLFKKINPSRDVLVIITIFSFIIIIFLIFYLH
jgi:hypothetical protein